MIIWTLIIICWITLSIAHLSNREIAQIETFDQGLSEIYQSMNLIDSSDAARRTLVRSALIQQRAQTLNLLQHLSTKIPPNCYDTKDPAYDSSACRQARNQRQAEITVFVNQAIVAFCASHADCKSVSRGAYVTNAWKQKCATTATTKLTQQSINNNLLMRNNAQYIYLPRTNLKSPCAVPIGNVDFPNASSQTQEALIAKATKVNGFQDAGTIAATSQGLQLCKDTKLDIDSDLITDPNSIVMLKKPLKDNQAALSESVAKTISSTDGWLDSYWYFQDDKTLKTDSDRLQKCSEALSQDDFLLTGQSLFESNAAKQVISDAQQTQTPAVINTSTDTMSLIQQYNTQRSQKHYPKGWYIDWQKALNDRYTTTQSLFAQRNKDLLNVQQSPLYGAYKKYQDLINLTQSDIQDLNKSIRQSISPTGSLDSLPICFKAGSETSFKDTSCCNLKSAKQTLVGYCPETNSVCAKIANENNNSKAFRSCKDVFADQINLNKYTDAVKAFNNVPEFKVLNDNMSVLTTAQNQASKDINDLESALRLNLADISAAI